MSQYKCSENVWHIPLYLVQCFLNVLFCNIRTRRKTDFCRKSSTVMVKVFLSPRIKKIYFYGHISTVARLMLFVLPEFRNRLLAPYVGCRDWILISTYSRIQKLDFCCYFTAVNSYVLLPLSPELKKRIFTVLTRLSWRKLFFHFLQNSKTWTLAAISRLSSLTFYFHFLQNSKMDFYCLNSSVATEAFFPLPPEFKTLIFTAISPLLLLMSSLLFI